METIKLVLPTEEYLDQVAEYRREFLADQSSMDGCGPLDEVESPEQWLAEVCSYTDPATLPEGKVLATLRKKEGP